MSEPQQERDVSGDQITVGPITKSIGVAIGPGAQANVTLFISSDDALGPERERLLELLSSLPLSQPLIVDNTPSSQRRPGEAAAALAHSQVLVMLLNGDINGYLESEQRQAREAGIADRLYLIKQPPDQENDPPLAELLGVPP